MAVALQLSDGRDLTILLEAVLPQAHMRRQGFLLEKTIILGKSEDSRTRGRPKRTWSDSMNKAMGVSLQEPSRAGEDRTLRPSLTPRVARSRS